MLATARMRFLQMLWRHPNSIQTTRSRRSSNSSRCFFRRLQHAESWLQRCYSHQKMSSDRGGQGSLLELPMNCSFGRTLKDMWPGKRWACRWLCIMCTKAKAAQPYCQAGHGPQGCASTCAPENIRHCKTRAGKTKDARGCK